MKLRQAYSHKDWRDIKKLYNEAFPANEKKPFWMIRWKCKQKVSDVWVLEQDDEFVGLAITMNGENLVLLDYFAVRSDKRGSGIGSQALAVLQEKYGEQRFFLEIESIEEGAKTQEERERRKKFYLANGMQELGVEVTLFGVDMELLGCNCNVDFEEYRGLYFDIYGNWAAKNVIRR
ncbi:MAG: GNAT family N-acetyltransferase [Lachnospiraceae bacterium]|nr:GNAT family N-acetyltransferase [Lachnospiraceae bacterium]